MRTCKIRSFARSSLRNALRPLQDRRMLRWRVTGRWLAIFWVTSVCISWPCRSTADDQGNLQYNRDVRPILADYCFSCHGPDSAARKADLRLDQREAAIEMGALQPGSPDESELLRRVMSDDPDEQMPPPATKKNLSSQQKDTLHRWIEQGAPYQPHWSLIVPQRPPLPAVRQSDWVRNPIDAFVLARLEQLGLEPAAEADRRTLVRRVSLDLTGLPPSPEIIDRFLQDSSESAYEQLIDDLLQSPRWGEHRARYWLDVARYADTHGIHFDNYREIWAYRDWVINAFNKNQPFDQFTMEQLAGDLLPEATLQQRIASGFNRCNITTNEGGVIPEEYLVLYTRDRTETVAQTWMGLTAGCAVCHDHKFDPLSQREFYEMAAFFNNSTQAAMDGNVKDTAPVVPVPLAQDLTRWNDLGQALAQARQAKDSRRAQARSDFDSWLASTNATELSASLPTDHLALEAPLN
jgi:cytochrome c553